MPYLNTLPGVLCGRIVDMRTLGVISAAVLASGLASDDWDSENAKLRVHLVPHSHMDTGWLKTVDQCYYGSNTTFQRAGVQYILDAVIGSLVMDPQRVFTFAEQAFFQRWWREQSNATRAVVRGLIERRQLVFVDGGWSQHDEGCVHYTTMLDQTTYGARFLKEEFDISPRIAWHLDPFGHTSTQAALLSAAAGMDAFYFARIDYQDRDQRRARGDMETVWNPSASLGRGVFSGALVQGAYCPPPLLDFGGNSKLPDGLPVMDDECLEGYNVDWYVDEFVDLAREYAGYSRGRDVMILVGCDYEYENAGVWYTNIDRLIRAVNADGRVEAMYSDPHTYTLAKHNETWGGGSGGGGGSPRIEWSKKIDDFIPCAQDWDEASGLRGHMVWSGYFTSRPTLKYFERASSAYLQAARSVAALAGPAARGEEFGALAAAVAVAAHHDAITGTSRQHVANDYARRLAAGHAAADAAAGAALGRLAGAPVSVAAGLKQCKRANESICEAFGQTLVVFNPLSRAISHRLRIPLPSNDGASWLARDAATGEKLPSLGLPATPFASEAQRDAMPLRNAGASESVLSVDVALPALGTRTLRLERGAAESSTLAAPAAPRGEDTVVLENERVKVTFEVSTGRLTRIEVSAEGDNGTAVSAKLDQSFQYYTANNSGPWMLRPDQTRADQAQCAGSCKANLKVTRAEDGTVVEVHQQFGDWVAQTARLPPGASHLELEWTVGPVPVERDGLSKEVFSRFSSDIASGDTWMTDSNAFETIKRRRNARASYELNVTEPIADNVVNVNAFISVRDKERSLVVANDRAQGGTSLRAGEIDVFVHRRLLGFDYPQGGMGPNGEPLNETRVFGWEGDDGTQWFRDGPGIVVRGTHYVTLAPPRLAARARRQVHEAHAFRRPVVAFSGERWDAAPARAGVAEGALPAAAHVVSLEPWDEADGDDKSDAVLLLRLGHRFALEEDDELSKPVNVSLGKLFTQFRVASATEVNLFANMDIDQVNKPLIWTENEQQAEGTSARPLGEDMVVELRPLHVRTFLLRVEYVKSEAY